MANIKFGTDGWRAIVGQDFNEENVAIVTKAIGKYVRENFGIEKKILIGYDPRNKADFFSKAAADILKEGGFTVLYSDKIVPTPVLAYNAKLLNACAMMFTASHNPPEYLGIKFIPDYAGPATSEITDELTENLGCEIEPGIGSIIEYDFSKDYFKHINSLINFSKIRADVIFDGLFSATIGYFDKILESKGIVFDAINMKHDINFGGGMPEPKSQYMQDLITMIIEKKNSAGEEIKYDQIGVANDGDGDRFGIINEKGEYVTPNEIIAILLRHLKKNKGLNGCLVKTVGASLLLDKVAKMLGVEVVETPVGFKHVGEAMRRFNPIIGGEESGGLSIQGHIPEKDGILANLLIMEAMGYENKTLVQLQEDLHSFVGCEFFNDRLDVKLKNRDDIEDIMFDIENEFEEITKKIDRKDGMKLYFDDDTSWILIRPSGTEPLLRIYFESDSMKKIEEKKEIICKFL